MQAPVIKGTEFPPEVKVVLFSFLGTKVEFFCGKNEILDKFFKVRVY